MSRPLENVQRIGELMTVHGRELIEGLLVVILGLLVVRWLLKGLRKLLSRFVSDAKVVATVTSVAGVLFVLVVVVAAAVEAGLPIQPIVRFLIAAALVAVGMIVFLRPMVPDLPFKLGNTVKVGTYFGKVEAITFLNTRMRTYDGKTIFIPNHKVFDGIVTNYHFTQTRRIKINLCIRYDSDLIRAKQVLEELMIEDPRVEATPRPVVYVLSLAKDGVELGARCWVANLKYWVTKCDLLEKVKLAFDREGIGIAHTQVDVYHYGEAPELGEPEEGEWA